MANSSEVNWGSLSETSCSGKPYAQNNCRRTLMVLAVMVAPTFQTSGHLEWASAISKHTVLEIFHDRSCEVYIHESSAKDCRARSISVKVPWLVHSWLPASQHRPSLLPQFLGQAPATTHSFWRSPSSSQYQCELHEASLWYRFGTSVAPPLWCPTAHTLPLWSTQGASARKASKSQGLSLASLVEWTDTPAPGQDLLAWPVPAAGKRAVASSFVQHWTQKSPKGSEQGAWGSTAVGTTHRHWHELQSVGTQWCSCMRTAEEPNAGDEPQWVKFLDAKHKR